MDVLKNGGDQSHHKSSIVDGNSNYIKFNTSRQLLDMPKRVLSIDFRVGIYIYLTRK